MGGECIDGDFKMPGCLSYTEDREMPQEDGV